MAYFDTIPLRALLLCGLALLAGADNSVHILSGKQRFSQLVTSSILNWVPASRYSASRDFVIGGFEIVKSEGEPTKRPIFVCRALHNGVWVAGGQREGVRRCVVTLTGVVRSYDSYHLLENVESAARLSWMDWSSGDQTPMGAVAPDNRHYVARHAAGGGGGGDGGEEPGQTHYIGTLVSSEPFGTITFAKENETEGSAGSGQLLVETEPISYDLNSVRLVDAKMRVNKREPRVLARATLRNDGPRRAKVAEAFGYQYLHTLYWGQGHAMLKGLDTTVRLQNRTRLPDIKWGLDARENRTGVYAVEVELDPGTAVNVTLLGEYAETEVPYSGKLLSYYEDNATVKPRQISGFRREDTVINVVPEIRAPFYLGNNSLAPTIEAAPAPNESSEETTTPTTTTTMQSTLGLTTTMPTTDRWDDRLYGRGEGAGATEVDEAPYERETDDNAILEAGRGGQTSEATGAMQGDDGGPQSLHDKAEEGGAHSGAEAQRRRVVFLALAMETGVGLALTAGGLVALAHCVT